MQTILCYGDSNTWGSIPLTEFPMRGGRFGLHERWTGVLQQTLGADYRIIEEGLGGRTTVRDDPIEGEHKNGKTYLLPCLETHQPINLVVLMLGTNDLKYRFGVSPYDIALSISTLIRIIQTSTCGREGQAPRILVLCPPPIIEVGNLGKMFAGGAEKSRALAAEYTQIAAFHECAFFDVGSIIHSSPVDGIHFDRESHAQLGTSLAEVIRAL